MRALSLLLLATLGGCASQKVDEQLDTKTANARAIEQVRMRAITSGEVASTRGAEIQVADPNKEFNLGAMRSAGSRTFQSKGARTDEFQFVDRVRTREFGTREYASKNAWMGDMKFATKAAPTKNSRYAQRSASTKTYETREARDAGKSMEVRALPGGDRAFVAEGRRQAALDANGRQTIPLGQRDLGPSWSGDLKPLTVDDVKQLLNKN